MRREHPHLHPILHICNSASDNFIQKHHITISPFQTTPFKSHLEIHYCFSGEDATSTTDLRGTGGKIVKQKSITKSKLFSSEQSRESVECTSLSPLRGTSTSIYRSSTTKSLRALIKAPFLSEQRIKLRCAAEWYFLWPCASLIRFFCI